MLVNRGHEVITCGNKITELIYKTEFPKIKHLSIEGYNPYYSNKDKQGWAMIKQTPKFLRIIKKETSLANKIAKENKIDIIISDNRFGFHSKSTYNIFICHQIQIQGPKILLPIFKKINHGYINKYDICWIPDINGKTTLAGKLSENVNLKTIKIGPLSRFNSPVKKENNFKYKFLGIISGPEPHQKILEKKLIKSFNSINEDCAIISGESEHRNKTIKNTTIFPHLKTTQFKEIVSQSENIICRSGYSNIMDLSVLQKNAILVPTPGQTEQEYLAKYHKKTSNIGYMTQHEINLKKANIIKGKINPFNKQKLLQAAMIKSGL